MACLQAVAHVCDFATAVIKVLFSALACPGKKSWGIGAIALYLTCGTGDFCLFLPASPRTTACKLGMGLYFRYLEIDTKLAADRG